MRAALSKHLDRFTNSGERSRRKDANKYFSRKNLPRLITKLWFRHLRLVSRERSLVLPRK